MGFREEIFIFDQFLNSVPMDSIYLKNLGLSY